MTLALRFAVRSDIGLRREGNEDSAYAGPHLLAVADGMGGHAAGEVASAAVITTVAALDADHAVDDLPGAVRDAVAAASQRLRELILADSARDGMGTTLTAMVWADGHVALGHVGDSRAYLLRGDQMYQVTRDHTKVQALLEQGKITEAEMHTHPERSVLLRALDGRHAVQPDVSVHEALPGDRYLLCSDGLCGVASERAMFQTLVSVRDPDTAALRLIDLACQGGGPDNITCIVADVVDTETDDEPPTFTATFAGAAADHASGEPAASEPDDARDPGLTMSIPQNLVRTRPQPALPDDTEDGLLDRRIASLEAAKVLHDATIARLSDEADEARAEARELRAALAEHELALGELRAEFMGLRDDLGTGDTPSPGIASRLREPAAPAAARDWRPPPGLADVPAPADETPGAGYTPRLAGYSGIGAGLLALGAEGTARDRQREDTAEGDTSDQPQG